MKMASGLTLKELYEKYYDSKIGLSTYFMPDSDFSQEAFIGRGEFLSRLFESELKGDILIKYGGALLPSSILPACESFKEIIIVDFLDSNLEVINQWLDKEPGTIVPCELEKHREIWTAKEEKMKKAIKQVIKGELVDCHPVAPGLAVQADCIFSEFCLEFLSTDEEGYCKALKSMSSLLKLGGCLVMFVFLDCTFYMIGNVKFPIVCLDLELVRKALTDSGFAIKELQLTPRVTKKLYSISDFSRKLFLVARKEEVKE